MQLSIVGEQAINVHISHPDLSWFDMGLGRGGPGCRTRTMELSVSRETGLRIKKPTQKTAPGFPGGAVVENLPANAGDTGSSPGLGRSHMPRSI